MIEGLDARDPAVRLLDQSRIGAVLTGEPEALKGRGPVKAMLIQNTNPMVVAPNQTKVRRGFMREDLFVCVHEQFMSETARHADVVLPATMFLEHDDLYKDLVYGYMHRYRIKPGITGWAQVNGYRGATRKVEKMEARVKFDLFYIHNWSFWFDIKIVLITLFKGFVNRNAY